MIGNIVSEAQQDGSSILDWLQSQGGRVFTELHISQRQAEVVKQLQALRETTAWQEAGCTIFMFMTLRCGSAHLVAMAIMR